ncbi:MAG: hypothetical protein IJI05_03515, partial [Erysipelotrichaceae bacterium]|nr:hypothetical protein [Erysipelotrichaceae bacterium]
MRAQIEKMKYNASLALNPYFELVKDEKHQEPQQHQPLMEMLKTVVTAIQNVKDTETEKINSYEIFVNEYYYHICNSQGVDVSFNTMDQEMEVIINSIDGDHEIELYHRIKSSGQPLEEITAGILEVFRYAKDRTRAVPTRKALDQTVLLSGVDNAEFFRYFLMKTNTSVVYQRASQVKPGDAVQEGDDCDRITVELKKQLPHSSRNMPYTTDGQKNSDVVIVDKGVYASYWGDKTTAYYLGIDEISGAGNYVVSGGTKTAAELHSEPYLEIIQFSNFIMNPMTGNIGGEIRLAYYYDGQTVTPVTGGSITCNMKNILNSIRMSKETRQYDNCVVPETIQLFNVAVAGLE